MESLCLRGERLEIYVYNKRTNVFLGIFISMCTVEKFMLNLTHFLNGPPKCYFKMNMLEIITQILYKKF